MIRSLRMLAAILALGLGAENAEAFNHHLRTTVKTTVSSSWSNVYSCKYAGSDTAGAGRTNWGQPASWCVNLSSNARSWSYWIRLNGTGSEVDGALLTSADQSTNSHLRMGTSGTALNNLYAGGQFVFTSCSATITVGVWTLLTMSYDGAGNVSVYVGNSSTSCIGTFSGVGSDLCTRDFLFNTLRGSTNSDVAFAEWGTPNLDELTVWSTALTGSDHVALQNAGHAINPTTHSKAGSLINYYRCGDDPSDTSSVLNDAVGAVDGTHVNTSNVSYQAAVP